MVICTNCKYFKYKIKGMGKNQHYYWCIFNPIIRVNAVTGEKYFTYESCFSKNTGGKCLNFVQKSPKISLIQKLISFLKNILCRK